MMRLKPDSEKEVLDNRGFPTDKYIASVVIDNGPSGPSGEVVATSVGLAGEITLLEQTSPVGLRPTATHIGDSGNEE